MLPHVFKYTPLRYKYIYRERDNVEVLRQHTQSKKEAINQSKTTKKKKKNMPRGGDKWDI